jgi:hypothetical protein
VTALGRQAQGIADGKFWKSEMALELSPPRAFMQNYPAGNTDNELEPPVSGGIAQLLVRWRRATPQPPDSTAATPTALGGLFRRFF